MAYIILYLLAGIITIYSEHFGLILLMYVSKILLMPLLALYLYTQTKDLKKFLFIYLALFFSWLGDIFLMFPRNEYEQSTAKILFLAGLVAFLIGHLNYIIYFIKEVKVKPKITLLVEKPYWVLPFVVFIVLLLKLLYPGLGAMKLPVTIYAIIISTMLLTAFNRKNISDNTSFLLIFSGALLFVFSDSCIALNLFYQPFDFARIAIMSTYVLAQALIIKGVQVASKSSN